VLVNEEEERDEWALVVQRGGAGGKVVEMEWVLDLGATTHVSSDLRPFVHMVPSKGEK
jgi:hypothetical protein